MARPRSILTVPAALALGVIAASCSGPERITLHDFLEQSAKVTCQTIVACSGTLDEAGCERGLGPDGFENAQTLVDVGSGKIVYDGAAAARCLDYRRRHAGDCDSGSLRADPAGAACKEIFTGTLQVGASCFFSSQCAPDAWCALTPCPCDVATGDCSCCAGTCEALSRFGEECSRRPCGPGLGCRWLPLAPAPVCEPLLEAGEVCDSLYDCVDSVECVPSAAGGVATCGVLPAEGESCASSEGAACARSDDYCDPTERICKRRLAVGAPCMPVMGPAPCVAYALCNDGRCSLPPGKGEACAKPPGGLGSLFVPVCAAGLVCSNQVCVVNDAPPPFTLKVCE